MISVRRAVLQINNKNTARKKKLFCKEDLSYLHRTQKSCATHKYSCYYVPVTLMFDYVTENALLHSSEYSQTKEQS